MTSIPGRDPDAEIRLQLLATSAGGRRGPIRSGYRPAHRVRADYLTTGVIHLTGRESLDPGEESPAFVTFISPENHPGSLRVGQILDVQEGGHLVGHATITRVINPVLLASAGATADPTSAVGSARGSTAADLEPEVRRANSRPRRTPVVVILAFDIAFLLSPVSALLSMTTYVPQAEAHGLSIAAGLALAALLLVALIWRRLPWPVRVLSAWILGLSAFSLWTIGDRCFW